MRQFKDDDFQFGFEIALGGAYRGSADAGEVLATAGRIKNGDDEGWLQEWLATAERCRANGQRAEQDGRTVTAVGCYRRAATYYSTALYRFAGASDNSEERELTLWRMQRQCWDRVVDLQPTPGERIAIPYEDTTLPGYFFRAPDAAAGERRPLVILNNGSDGATSGMWDAGGAGAAERGYHWMTFDGPGQQAALFEQGIGFRPDWEAVLTPVLDAMIARPDIEAERIAVIGISQAGFWVPRALAFEHRFAAAVVDPGVTDVSASWTRPLPQPMRKRLVQGKRDAFDRWMRLTERFSPATSAVFAFRGRPYMLDTDSRFDLYREVMRYRLDGEERQITTPMLIADPEDEQFWPGQPQELHDRLPGERELVRFTAAEGTNRHCEPLGRATRDARVLDWLGRYLG